MKTLVLGSNGMLGRYVKQYLDADGGTRGFLNAVTFVDDKATRFAFEHELTWRDYDLVVNCIGVIKPQVAQVGVADTIKINSIFPHMLADTCAFHKIKLVHVTTDCVFSGHNGPYRENLLHDATDLYGRSKSLGEPQNCATIRTSIIGEEVGQSRSLVEWFKSQKDGRCSGYVNHYWNGITCLQFAKVVEWMISKNMFWEGVRHVYSPDPVSKYELLKLLNDAYNLNVTIAPSAGSEACDRRLWSMYESKPYLDIIPPIEKQISEMAEVKLR